MLIVLVWQILVKTDTTTNQGIDLESTEKVYDKSEETGWKMIRIEVFKCPPQRNLLCASIGSGIQLILIVIKSLVYSNIIT